MLHQLIERVGGGKNLIAIIVGIIAAVIVAVGWGFSSWQSAQGMIDVGRLLLH